MTVRWLYRLGVLSYGAAIRLAAVFNPKAKKWVNGRIDMWKRIEALPVPTSAGRVWVHCASLGEFEMARPVMEQLRAHRPNVSIVVSFFSPSGYDIRKDFAGCDAVLYLPLDTPANAQRFVTTLRPTLAIFVKYDLWWEHLAACSANRIPVHLICARFSISQAFFRFPKLYGKPLLSTISHFHALDQNSASALGSVGFQNVSIDGDTRYDRVMHMARTAPPVESIAQWKGDNSLIVCASTWPADEALIFEAIVRLGPDVKWLIVPHEVGQSHLSKLQQQVVGSVLFGEIGKRPSQVVIMDRIGLLGRCYRHATLAYVGGAFGSGLHNILESTAFGIPVVFGPRYNSFTDATQMVNQGLAFSISNAEELTSTLAKLLQNANRVDPALVRFMEEREGATERIMAGLDQGKTNSTAKTDY